MIPATRNTTRRGALALLVVPLFGCAGIAKTTSVNSAASLPLNLKSVDFIFQHVRLPTSIRNDSTGLQLATGYSAPTYAGNISRHIESAFLVNGIKASVHVIESSADKAMPSSEYYFVAWPSSVQTWGQRAGPVLNAWLDMRIGLYRRGAQQPIWTGEKSVNIKSDESTVGSWALSILNALQAANVIALPGGVARTPQGNRGYLWDARDK